MKFDSYAPKLWSLVIGAILFTLATWLYWPGHNGPELLDDRSSILVLEEVRESPELIWDAIFGDRSGILGRWVSMSSFVLEKLYLGDSLAISKKVNITLHLFNALLVILLLRALFQVICDERSATWLALALGACWLVTPLFVSTVLYVVQRMAMLSATFMLLACLSYCRWRHSLSVGRNAWFALFLAAFFTIVGLFAKENAIVVVPVIFLLESLWYQWRDDHGRPIVWLRRLTLSGIVLGGLGLIVTLLLRYESLASAFRYRPFSLEDRLLTQTRVLWDYLGQLVSPDLSRLGIYHDDFVISTGLGSPPTTLYAIVAWVVVLFVSLVLLRWPWGRRLAIGPAWYLLAHAVESSVLPLELYFEHRNYFPVIGLYLAVGSVFALLVRQMPQIRSPLMVWVFMYALWLALQTSSQVVIWSQRELIIFNHLNGHPYSPRANMDMAVLMAGVGDLERARYYSEVAFENSPEKSQVEGDLDLRNLSLVCITQRPIAAGEIERIGTGNPLRPISSVTTLLTFARLHQEGACPDFPWRKSADRLVDIYLATDSIATAAPNIYLTLAGLENSLQRFDMAYQYMLRFREALPDNTRGQLMQLHFTTALGKVDEANELRQQLLDKQARGELTVGEQQNLALYLPADNQE